MSFIEAIERGLANTQLESALLDPLVDIACAFPFPFEADVTRGDETDGVADEDVDDLPRPREGLGDSSVRKRLGTSGGNGAVFAGARPSWWWCAALSRLLFLRRVAKSGLLAVPGERYIERLLVCRSVSSSAS